jgi:ABC-type phosphate transport system substrate-binding protein
VSHPARAARAAASALARAALLASLVLAPGALRAQGEAYRVIVNSGNRIEALPRAEVARLFLKKTVAWPGGEPVIPVDRAEDADVRRSFSKGVLGKDVPAVKGYWQQLIFTGRAVPPVEKATDAEVVAFVAANAAAIGYVSASAPLGAGVKVLRVSN